MLPLCCLSYLLYFIFVFASFSNHFLIYLFSVFNSPVYLCVLSIHIPYVVYFLFLIKRFICCFLSHLVKHFITLLLSIYIVASLKFNPLKILVKFMLYGYFLFLISISFRHFSCYTRLFVGKIPLNGPKGSAHFCFTSD